MTAQKELMYRISDEDLNTLQDYFNAALEGEESTVKLKNHWKSEYSVIRSHPLEDAPTEQEQLAELWQFCLKNGVELHDDLIGYRGDDKFLLLTILKKIAELRGKK